LDALEVIVKHMLFGVTSAALLVAGFAFSGSAQEV
jgi:hypothetical protein